MFLKLDIAMDVHSGERSVVLACGKNWVELADGRKSVSRVRWAGSLKLLLKRLDEQDAYYEFYKRKKFYSFERKTEVLQSTQFITERIIQDIIFFTKQLGQHNGR